MPEKSVKSVIYTPTFFCYNFFMDPLHSIKIDKTVFKIASLSDPSDEKEYWLSNTPAERLQAIELMRQIIYGYNPATTRLQRVFEVTQLS